MTKPKRTEVKTVGELAAILATMPANMPLYRRGNIGNWVQGFEIGVQKLALFKAHEENYVADLTAPVWRSKKDAFDPEFKAATIT